jgi:prolipoprotein diacylglyceryltransferase
LLGCYLIASGAGRFLVEFLSRNAVLAFGLKEAQLVSAVMMVGGISVLSFVCLVGRTETPTLCGVTTYLDLEQIALCCEPAQDVQRRSFWKKAA